MLEITSAPVPVTLLTVTGSAAEATPTTWGVVNAIGLGVTTSTGDPSWPVPLSVMDCGWPTALFATETLAANARTTFGVKVTLIVQLCRRGERGAASACGREAEVSGIGTGEGDRNARLVGLCRYWSE